MRARSGLETVYRLLAHQERDFLSAMGDLRGRRVLSYGCGTGYVTPLAQLGARVTGLDLSESAIALLSRAIRDEGLDGLADARVGDCHATPFADGSFDLVVGSGILHHLDTERAAREVRRVLRPGGRAVFREPLATSPLLALFRLATPGRRTPDEHPYLPRDFRILRECFAGVRWRGYGVLLPLALTDRLLGRIPAVRWLSWSALIELEG